MLLYCYLQIYVIPGGNYTKGLQRVMEYIIKHLFYLCNFSVYFKKFQCLFACKYVIFLMSLFLCLIYHHYKYPHQIINWHSLLKITLVKHFDHTGHNSLIFLNVYMCTFFSTAIQLLTSHDVRIVSFKHLRKNNCIYYCYFYY